MRIIQSSCKLLNIICTMDLFFIAIFAFARAAELCEATKLEEKYKGYDKVAEIPSDKLYLFKTEVEEIKGISSQSVDDLVNAATELKRNFQAYTFFTETVLSLGNFMGANENMLNATVVEEVFNKYKKTHTPEEAEQSKTQHRELCSELEEILVQKLQPEPFNRVKIFLRMGWGTREEIEAALAYLYGTATA